VTRLKSIQPQRNTEEHRGKLIRDSSRRLLPLGGCLDLRHIILVRDAFGRAGAGVAEEGVEARGAGAVAVAGIGDGTGVDAVAAVAVAVGIIDDGRINAVFAAPADAVAIVRRGGVEAFAGAAQTFAIQRGGGLQADAAAIAFAITVLGDVGEKAGVAGTLAVTIGNFLAFHGQPAAVQRGTVLDGGGKNAIGAHRAHGAGFHRGGIAGAQIDAVIQAAGDGDVGDEHVARLDAGTINAVGKAVAGVEAVAVVGDAAHDMAVDDGDVSDVAIERNARAKTAGGGGGNGEAVQIKRHAVGVDINAVAGADGEVVGEIVGAGQGNFRQRAGVGDGRARLDLVEGFHGGRGRAGRGEDALGEGRRQKAEGRKEGGGGEVCFHNLVVGGDGGVAGSFLVQV